MRHVDASTPPYQAVTMGVLGAIVWGSVTVATQQRTQWPLWVATLAAAVGILVAVQGLTRSGPPWTA